MKLEKKILKDSKTGKADSLILLLASVIGKLFTGLISFGENSLFRCFADEFIILCPSFLDCRSMTCPCSVLVDSLKARLNNSNIINEYLSAIPMGYYKMVPQYLPRAPD